MKNIVILVCLVLAGCGASRSLVRLDAADQYELAKKEFEKKKYREAAEGFKRVLFEHPGSDFVDDAQYWLAQSYFQLKDYRQARGEFSFLLDNFPQSAYRDDSFFKLGVCYYNSSPSYHLDQTDTKRALQIFEDFSLRYPDSDLLPKVDEYRRDCLDKLAKKELEAGRLYLKLRKYSAAEMYFEDAAERFPNSEHFEESRLLLGVCYERQGRTEEALEVYREIADSDGKFSTEAEKRVKALERNQ